VGIRVSFCGGKGDHSLNLITCLYLVWRLELYLQALICDIMAWYLDIWIASIVIFYWIMFPNYRKDEPWLLLVSTHEKKIFTQKGQYDLCYHFSPLSFLHHFVLYFPTFLCKLVAKMGCNMTCIYSISVYHWTDAKKSQSLHIVVPNVRIHVKYCNRT